MELKILSPQDTHCLSRCGAGQGFIIRAPSLEIYTACQRRGQDGLLTSPSAPTAPAGATRGSPGSRERQALKGQLHTTLFQQPLHTNRQQSNLWRPQTPQWRHWND